MGKPAQRRGAIPSPAERALAARIAAAKAGVGAVDRLGEYAQQCRELSVETGTPFDALYEEWSARSGSREYDAGMTRDDAEMLAMEDVLERFRVQGRLS